MVLSESRQKNGEGVGVAVKGWDVRGGGGRGGGLSVGVYRSELSVDLKQSSDSAVTTSVRVPLRPRSRRSSLDGKN